jgi:hypothetical protein
MTTTTLSNLFHNDKLRTRLFYTTLAILMITPPVQSLCWRSWRLS